MGEAFDVTTYYKGASVLRMIEDNLGGPTFARGLQHFLQRHRWSTATSDDFWQALTEVSGRDITALTRPWLERAGCPLITIRPGSAAGQLTLAQQRFLDDPREPAGEADAPWAVPMTLRSAGRDAVQTQALVLSEREARVDLVSGPEARLHSANASAAGFYRIFHEGPLFEQILAALPQLDAAERTALLADEWAFAQTGRASIGRYLRLGARLGGDADPVVLSQLTARLFSIEHRYVDEAHRGTFRRYVAATLAGRTIESARSGGAGPIAWKTLVLLARSAEAMREAEDAFQEILHTGATGLGSDLNEAVLVSAARGADARRWEELLGVAGAARDPLLRKQVLLAMAQVETPALMERVIGVAFSPAVPASDFPSYLGRLIRNGTTRQAAWRQIRARWPEVCARADSEFGYRRVLEAFIGFVEPEDCRAAEAFLAEQAVPAAAQTTAMILENFATEAARRPRLLREIGDWLDTWSPAGATAA